MICPVCRARNEQGPQCRRCRADLSLLFSVEEERRALLAGVRSSLAAQDWHRALTLLEGAEALRSGPDLARLRALIYLLRHDFPRTWQAYQTTTRKNEGGGSG